MLSSPSLPALPSMALVAADVRRRFLHWVRESQRLPLHMSAIEYYNEMVAQVLAPGLSKFSPAAASGGSASWPPDVTTETRIATAAAGGEGGGSASAATVDSNDPPGVREVLPLDEEGLRIFVAQHLTDPSSGPRSTKCFYRALESFLGLEASRPDAGGSSLASAARKTPAAESVRVCAMAEELRAALVQYLVRAAQATEAAAAAWVDGMDALIGQVLSERDELVPEGVRSAEQLSAVLVHHLDVLYAKVGEAGGALGWGIAHMRRFAAGGGAQVERVLEQLLATGFASWLTRQALVRDAAAAHACVEQVESLLRPFLKPPHEHAISADRAREILTTCPVVPAGAPRPPVLDRFESFLKPKPASSSSSSSSSHPPWPRRRLHGGQADDTAKALLLAPELRAEFHQFLTTARKLADVTASVVLTDVERMLDYMRRRLGEEGGGTSSLDKEAARKLLEEHQQLSADYVTMRRREGRQSSILPHTQAFFGLPATVVRGPKRPRVDSIIAPELRTVFMTWLQSEKGLSAKCSKNYLGELSSMLKHLVAVARPDDSDDAQQLLLNKEKVRDLLTQHRTPHLEQVVEERRKSGKLREAALAWLEVFLGIRPEKDAQHASTAAANKNGATRKPAGRSTAETAPDDDAIDQRSTGEGGEEEEQQQGPPAPDMQGQDGHRRQQEEDDDEEEAETEEEDNGMAQAGGYKRARTEGGSGSGEGTSSPMGAVHPPPPAQGPLPFQQI